MAYTIASLDELGEGYGFRKIRQALGVTAFGVNALVFPPELRGPRSLPRQQDELYFVHRGTATFDVRRRRARSRRGRPRARRVDDAPQGLEPHRRATSSSSSSAARAATSSATASSSAPRTSRSGRGSRRGRERPDDGHAADAADPAAPLGGVLRRQGDRHPAARQELPPLHVRDSARRARALAVGAAEPRPRARRPRRDALLEPLPASRGVPRHPVRRLRAAHAEPAAAPERPRVHREPRRATGP